MINKPNNVKNCYYINYIVELANFFGCQQVIDQCKNLGYELKLPKDIEEFKFRDIACMYVFVYSVKVMMIYLMICFIDCWL